MRRDSLQYNALELLPAENDLRYPQQSQRYTKAASTDNLAAPYDTQHGHNATSQLRRMPGIRQLSYFLPLIVSVVPLALLLGYSPKLSHSIAKSACTPGGEFVIPFTASVWNSSAFFEITIPFLGPDHLTCSYSVLDPFATDGDCDGYTFTQVKVIDLAWDVLVGRGGQAVLVWAAYRLFSRVIMALMQKGEVGYEAFATVAFETGSFSSIVPLFRQAIGLTPIPRTRRAIWSFAAMFLATVYIIAVPSLVSAMTGYTSLFTPYARLGNAQGSNGTLVSCDPTLRPLWGRLGVSELYIEGQNPGIYPIAGTNTSMISYEESYMWIEYYHRYEAVYERCPQSLDISSCKAARRKTVLSYHYPSNDSSALVSFDVASPMPGIVPYPNTTDSGEAKGYRYWQCGYEQLIDTRGLVQSPGFDVNSDPDDQSVGVCQANKRYAWGFSFLFAFLVAILHLLFAILMYALSLSHRRERVADSRAAAPGTFPDAVTMVTQAQKQYGIKLDEWGADGLKKDILYGRSGMSFISDEGLRNRKAEQSQALGDARGGDWGGDVVLEDERT